jgi:beta-galactosidase
MWMDVAYEPGTLKVVAFDEQGNPVAEKKITTAGKPHQIVLQSDRATLKANGEDLAFVEVSVVDKNGIPCPTASHQLKFKVSGNGVFRAACNGDPTSLEPFHLPTMKLFSGKLVVILESTNAPGDIKLKVSGPDLRPGSLSLLSQDTN